jgi:FRG domain-containing protein
VTERLGPAKGREAKSVTDESPQTARVVATWEQFEVELSELQRQANTRPGYKTALLFRGQGDALWPLDTTLERAGRRAMKLSEYHHLIASIQTEVESFAGYEWRVPTFESVVQVFSEYDSGSIELWQGKYPAYEFLIYLRHHGFPSPLLDWSRSPYVAAFFAFREVKQCDHVAIYVYDERPDNVKLSGSDRPNIHRFGPNVRTHRRHFLQQSEYTVCTRFGNEWEFASHQSVFDLGNRHQDLLTRFDIPMSEREKVLRRLDAYNLNASSLFGSEESLMETLAMRKFV